jgi:3-deoxy-manno-octulosonate cytidylyltransferase (CMP-KDO synthetase)
MTRGPEERRPAGALAIVPARLASERLPGKVLLRETGRFLFEHTVRNVERCHAIDRVVLATDAEEVVAAAREVGIEAVLTSPRHPSGTDRAREALDLLVKREGSEPWEVVINVQADEPEVEPAHLSELATEFSDRKVEIATLCTVASADDVVDPSAVKVVRGRDGDALYFSRAAIPNRSHSRASSSSTPLRTWRHIGVYAFRPAALRAFCDLAVGELEGVESLEQLRWLEAGRSMRVVPVSGAAPGIDTAGDYAAFVARARAATS